MYLPNHSGINSHPDHIATSIPVQGVIAWHKNFTGGNTTLPDAWLECNGQIINNPKSPINGQAVPNLNGTQAFLRGNGTSGGTGGTTTHTHSHQDGSATGGPSTTQIVTVGEQTAASSTHTHVVPSLNNTNHLPTFFNMNWIMRIY